jgi:Nuclease-related domain
LLSPDPRLLAWLRRALLVLIVGVPVSLLVDWRVGVTAAVVVAVIDTIYSARTMALIPASARVTSAQRKTRRRLFFARPFGYMAVHARAIPGTDSVIDHLVVGPSGVIAIDSEHWDRRLPVRTVASSAGPVLYHGPFSQKQRLAHARWEAAQASRLLSAELHREIPVAPAMVIYGPSIPWKVASIRGVEVLAGRNVGSYLRGRSRARRTRGRSARSASTEHLGWDQTGEIFVAAERALPPAFGRPVPRGPHTRRESPKADS